MIKLPLYLKLAHITYQGMCEQERTGFMFNSGKAEKIIPEITKTMEAIQAEIEPKLPTRQPLKSELSKMTPPKLQFKKDGTPSANAEKWFDKVELATEDWGTCYFGWKGGKEYQLPHHEPIITELPMTLSNGDQIKEWLLRGFVDDDKELCYDKVYWRDD
jgi:hypothetical protein